MTENSSRCIKYQSVSRDKKRNVLSSTQYLRTIKYNEDNSEILSSILERRPLGGQNSIVNALYISKENYNLLKKKSLKYKGLPKVILKQLMDAANKGKDHSGFGGRFVRWEVTDDWETDTKAKAKIYFSG